MWLLNCWIKSTIWKKSAAPAAIYSLKWNVPGKYFLYLRKLKHMHVNVCTIPCSWKKYWFFEIFTVQCSVVNWHCDSINYVYFMQMLAFSWYGVTQVKNPRTQWYIATENNDDFKYLELYEQRYSEGRRGRKIYKINCLK